MRSDFVSLSGGVGDQSRMMLRIVLALSLVASTAAAGPQVSVAPDAPFSAHELGEALALRIADDIAVNVTRDRDGRLVVDVGGRNQLVDPAGDSREVARVVAMVVVALVEQPAPAQLEVHDSPPQPVAKSQPFASPYTLRAVASGMRDDSGYTTLAAAGTVGYRIAPHARFVASLGVGQVTNKFSETELVVPVKLGIEGVAGSLGLELGGFALFHQSACTDRREALAGAYGAVRVYLPVSPRTRVVIEGGGQYTLNDPGFCDGEIAAFNEYAGWGGAGAEWSF
jgi:hypothetical protein